MRLASFYIPWRRSPKSSRFMMFSVDIETLQCFKKCTYSKHVETSQWIFWTKQLASSTWSENWGLLWEIMTDIAKEAEKLGPTFLLELDEKFIDRLQILLPTLSEINFHFSYGFWWL